MSEDARKRPIEIDSLADLELPATKQINQSIQTSATGTAPSIEARAQVWVADRVCAATVVGGEGTASNALWAGPSHGWRSRGT